MLRFAAVGSILSCCQRSSDSAAATAALSRASEYGATASSPPVRSTTPITSPVPGAWMGTAEQLQEWAISLKCSAPETCTPPPVARAVPGAEVPTVRSDQSAPGTKAMDSACRSTWLSPLTQSRRPVWSPMARINPVSRAGSSRSLSKTGSTRRSGESVRNWFRSPSASTVCSLDVESSWKPMERIHDSLTTSRN